MAEPGKPAIKALANQRLNLIASNDDEDIKFQKKESSAKDAVDSLSKKEGITEELLKPELQNYILKLVETARGSVDASINKRHPNYKGPRVQRTHKFMLKSYLWLMNIHENKKIDMAEIINKALESYLKNEFPEFEPDEEAVKISSIR